MVRLSGAWSLDRSVLPRSTLVLSLSAYSIFPATPSNYSIQCQMVGLDPQSGWCREQSEVVSYFRTDRTRPSLTATTHQRPQLDSPILNTPPFLPPVFISIQSAALGLVHHPRLSLHLDRGGSRYYAHKWAFVRDGVGYRKADRSKSDLNREGIKEKQREETRRCAAFSRTGRGSEAHPRAYPAILPSPFPLTSLAFYHESSSSTFTY